ncbi:vWA domain-containing protein [Yoonia sp. 2307UL14-13]|uniref:vWA domain-containing protein n=1 Tax=Yoonia sp. 2307UL14-13 TaxID=3126506 RepID=UPI0030A1A4E1
MTDDLNDLKAMMDRATPRPDAARRAENLALAQKNFEDLQGSRKAARPTPANRPKGLWTGVKTMLNTFTSKAALTTTTALVACGFLFLTPQGQDLLSPPTDGELTRSEFDGDVAQPEVEREPFRAEDMPSDMILREPLGDDEAEVIQSPPRAPTPEITEAVPKNDEASTIDLTFGDGETVRVPVQPSNTASVRPEPRERVVENIDELAAESAETALQQSADSSSILLGVTDSITPAPVPTAPLAPPPTARSIAQTAPPAIGAQSNNSSDFTAADMGAIFDEVAPAPAPATEAFPTEALNDLKITSEDPVSTFSIDVDTAAYSVVRSSLTGGQLPPPQAVRIEEMINYFPYDYPAPDAGEAPFRPTVSAFPTPWNADTQLVHIALQGEMPALDDRPPLNLVFLIDTSGSMNQPNKLPLLKQSFRLMLDQLRPEDEVAIVAYAGSAGQVLAPTPASDRQTILQAIQSLQPGGGTNGQGGLQQAYAIADRMAEDGEVGRILLATDGDFNVGISNPDALKDFIADKRETGTYLSVLGFGRGNLDDATMQALAQNGNGTAAYIDTLNEAQKVLVDQLSGALFPIAGDVKVQVEFNPEQVAEYRLIGYETRALARKDFNNDKVDAGELGAGHAVTAIYEITPVGSPAQLSDPLRYAPNTVAASSEELGYVKLRYKEPGEDTSQLIETPIIGSDIPGAEANFAAAIAGFGQLLRDDRYLGDWGYDDAIALANANRAEDPFGYRTEAVQLMRLAQSLSR